MKANRPKKENSMFNQHNTDGYTDEQLNEFNVELDNRLIGIIDPEQRSEIEKNFSDEVARDNGYN